MQRHLRAVETYSHLHIVTAHLPGLLGLLPRKVRTWKIVRSIHGVWQCQISVLRRFAVAQRTIVLKEME